MKAVYLLPCSCGNKIPVDAGQAGTKIACDCGQQLAVPTFRVLRNLQPEVPVTAVAVAAEQGSGWSAFRGLMFSFGMLVSVIAAVLVSYHLYKYSLLWDGGDRWKQAHLEDMRDAVDFLTPAEALADFQEMEKKGLTVDGVPPWSHLTDMRDSSLQWLRGELVALAVGIVSLFASLIGLRSSRAK